MGADLRTSYLGLELPSPLVVSACPLSRDVRTVERLAAAGAGAIVLFSLFEEQFGSRRRDNGAADDWLDVEHKVDRDEFLTTPSAYIDHIQTLKRAVGIPIIASLNASHTGSWLDFAQEIEQAGADGLELNIYKVVSDPSLDASRIEDVYASIVERVRAATALPLAVKLSPYFTSVPAIVSRLDALGVDAFVLFNRFYQPTIDVERRRIVMSLELSSPSEARLPLMWIALLRGQVRANLAATSGIHNARDVVRALMAGADVTMLCSALLRYGVDRLGDVHRLLVDWLEKHGHASVSEIRGVMSAAAQGDSADYQRAGYTKLMNRFW